MKVTLSDRVFEEFFVFKIVIFDVQIILKTKFLLIPCQFVALMH